MRKYALPFFLILTALGILAVFAYKYFEIYETTEYKKPSLQARVNDYLAMERWLNKTDHPVRVISYANSSIILSAPEKTAIILASLFFWNQDGYSKLEQWAGEGGHLIICLDIDEEEAEEFGLPEFLEKYGIEAKYEATYPYMSQKDSQASRASENTSSASNDAFPAFDSSVSFKVSPAKKTPIPIAAPKIEAISDASEKIKLVTIPTGGGSITFCGDPVFMKSHNLNKEKNALLAWNLTGKQDIEKKGVLFIRGIKTEPSFFGKLAERGNFLPLLVSVLVLIAVGFWMVIPVFGTLAGDEERPGKPMSERFLAEARFLKKYKGLGSYLEIYYLSLKKRFSRQYGETIDDESAFFTRLAEICNLNKEDVAEALSASGHLTNREFIKHIYTIETIMERL